MVGSLLMGQAWINSQFAKEADNQHGSNGGETMASTRYLSVKNWEQFQHYKDRRPLWIKLHLEILDDYEYSMLPDTIKYHLMMLWVYAASVDNKIPCNPLFLQKRLHLEQIPDLDFMIEHKWLVEWEEEKSKGKYEDWGSRHVPDAMKAKVMIRDNSKCRACGSEKRLEFDHIVPISKGGKTAISNIQLLCRPCNREKHNKDPYQFATQEKNLRSLETETEKETEVEKEKDGEVEGEVASRPTVSASPILPDGTGQAIADQAASAYQARRYKTPNPRAAYYPVLLQEVADVFEAVADKDAALKLFLQTCETSPLPKDASFSDLAKSCGLKKHKAKSLDRPSQQYKDYTAERLARSMDATK